MSKNVVVVTSSLREQSNSSLLAENFIKGAKSANNNVTQIEIKKLNLRFCKGCLACQKSQRCIINDDMNNLYQVVQNADVLVFATPIYYYTMAGQLKTFLDRLNPLYPRNNQFKEIYLLATCADDQEQAIDGTINELEGWISCFEGVKLVKVIKGLNVNGVGEILNTEIYKEAFEIGLRV